MTSTQSVATVSASTPIASATTTATSPDFAASTFHHDTTNDGDCDDDDTDGADWEEWDGRSPFWAHCVAGSLAGVVEHAAIYPLDTVRTHIQVCAACVHRMNQSAFPAAASSGTSGSTSVTSSMGTGTTYASSTHSAWNASSSSSSVSRSARSASAKFTTAVVAAASAPPPTTPTVAAPSPPLLLPSSPYHRLPLGMWQTIRFLVNEPVVAAATDALGSGSSSSGGGGIMSRLMPHSLVHPATPPTTATTAAATAAAANNLAKGGWTRLFRGVQTTLIGCVPAHALYFSSYETIKAYYINETTGHISAFGSSLAGAAAVTSHDLVMTPLDTIKQRLQIGHYSNSWQALESIYGQEGFIALYRSFPITLASNIPYGMVMVSTHEACKTALRESQTFQDRPHWQIVLGASSVSGLVASAVTTPLDRIKTALQTQQLAPVCHALQAPCPLTATTTTTAAANANANATRFIPPKHVNWHQAALTIWNHEGAAGFFRGMTPRILSHTPAVAISWTTYETAKHYLLSHS